MLLTWPELRPLLESFANRDPGTFMHSAAVHFTADKLAQDLFLLLKPSFAIQNEVQKRSPFWMLHDIGKNAANQDKETAQKLVHPVHMLHRPAYDRARHWIHPQMGADLLMLWATKSAPKLQPQLKKWAQLTCLHDRQLNPYLECDIQQTSWLDKFTLFIFSLADTSMAMGLPRPNKKTIHNSNEIRQALQRKYLNDRTLQELFPGKNHNQLRDFIITSVLHSLGELQKNYPSSVWTQPTGFTNQTFRVPVDLNNGKAEPLDVLVIRAYEEHEKGWHRLMEELDKKGVF